VGLYFAGRVEEALALWQRVIAQVGANAGMTGAIGMPAPLRRALREVARPDAPAERGPTRAGSSLGTGRPGSIALALTRLHWMAVTRPHAPPARRTAIAARIPTYGLERMESRTWYRPRSVSGSAADATSMRIRM
jgi:hypothetical protein